MSQEKEFATHEEYVGKLLIAMEKEQTDRAAAFLNITETIGEFEVLPMSLRHFTALQLIRSPFLPPFRTPQIEDIAAFLWILSPGYNPNNLKARYDVVKRCRQFMPPSFPLIKTVGFIRLWNRKFESRLIKTGVIVGKIREFVSDALADRPPSIQSNNIAEPDYFSDACFFCAILSREFHFSKEEVMDMPLKCIFQFVNAAKWFNQEKPILFNPSDAVKNRYLKQLNAKERN